MMIKNSTIHMAFSLFKKQTCMDLIIIVIILQRVIVIILLIISKIWFIYLYWNL